MTHALPSPAEPLKIGTRGSPLALAQAYETRARLCAAHGWSEDAFWNRHYHGVRMDAK